MKAYTAHGSLAAAALAGFLLAGTACAGPQASSTQPTVVAPVDTTTPTSQPVPAPTTIKTSPVPAPAVSEAQTAPAHGEPSAAVEPPRAAALQTFTFPDGHISFTYPAGWKIRTEQGPYLTAESKAGSVSAIVTDGSGAEVARLLSGMYGDGAAGRVKRTVIDQAPVPGITSKEPVHFGFVRDEIQPGDEEYYFMDVRLAHEFQPAETGSGSNQIPLANGIMTASVIFDYEKQPVFASIDAAKAWMATEQYAKLKALLLSLKYV